MNEKIEPSSEKEMEPKVEEYILTQKQKVLYVIIFFLGVICSYPSILPIGVFLASILLFKKHNKKINYLGLFLLISQVFAITVFLTLLINMPSGN